MSRGLIETVCRSARGESDNGHADEVNATAVEPLNEGRLAPSHKALNSLASVDALVPVHAAFRRRVFALAKKKRVMAQY